MTLESFESVFIGRWGLDLNVEWTTLWVTKSPSSDSGPVLLPCQASGCPTPGEPWGLFNTIKLREVSDIDEMDGPTLAAMFRAEARAAELINSDPASFTHYFLEEAGGLLEPHEFHSWRLLYAPPAPYTAERFHDTYRWMLGYPGLVAPGATYESVVDNRAWD